MQPLQSYTFSANYRIPGIKFNDPRATINEKKLNKWIQQDQSNIRILAQALLENPAWMQLNKEVVGKIFAKLDMATLKPKTAKLIQQVDQMVQTAFSRSTDIGPLLTEKNIANFLGDVFILKDHGMEGKLAGNRLDNACNFIAAVLEHVDTEGVTREEIQKQLKEIAAQESDIQVVRRLVAMWTKDVEKAKQENSTAPIPEMGSRKELAQKLESDIKGMKPGEALLLPSGWVESSSGHAMICKITCVDHGFYDMTVYNTGDGLHYHTAAFGTNKIYHDQTFSFRNISLHDLCERSFIEGAIELRTSPPLIGMNSHNAGDIYKRLFSRFESYRDPLSDDLHSFITPQRSGTCSIRVLMAFLDGELVNKLGNEEGKIAYRKLRNKMNKFVLEKALEKYQSQLMDNPAMLNLLKLSAESYARRLLKLEKGKIRPKLIAEEIGCLSVSSAQTSSVKLIEQNEILEGLKTVLKVLEATKASAKAPVSSHPDVMSVDIQKDHTLNDSMAAQSQAIANGMQLQHPQDVHLEAELPIPIPGRIDPSTITGQDLIIHLNTVYGVASQLLEKKENGIAGDLIVRSLLDLPMPTFPLEEDQFWNRFSFEEKVQLMEWLPRMTNLLNNCQEVCFADVSIALHSVQAAAFVLLSSIDPNFSDANVSMDYTYLIAHLENREVLSYNKELEDRLHYLIDFYKQIQSNTKVDAPLFDYSHWCKKSMNLPVPASSGEYKYLSNVLKGYPEEYLSKAKKEYEKYPFLHDKVTLEQFYISMAFLGNGKYVEPDLLEKTKYFHALKSLSLDLQSLYKFGSIKDKPLKPFLEMDFSASPQLGSGAGLSPMTFRIKCNRDYQSDCFDKKLEQNFYSRAIKSIGKNPNTDIGTRAAAHERFDKETDVYDSVRDCEGMVQNQLFMEDSKKVIQLFEPLLHKNLSSHLLRKYLENNLQKFRDPAIRTWFKLGLFHQEALYPNIIDEPLLPGQLFDAFKVATEAMRSELDLTKNKPLPIFPNMGYNPNLTRKELVDRDKQLKECYKLAKKGPLTQYLYFIDLKIRLTNYFGEEFDDQLYTAREELREILSDTCPWPDKHFSNMASKAKELLAFSYQKIPPKNPEEWREYFIGITDMDQKLGRRHEPERRHLICQKNQQEQQTLREQLNSDNRTYYLNAIMDSHYGIHLAPNILWEGDFPNYSARDNRNNLIEINILSGMITSNKLPIQGIAFLKSEYYSRIFGNRSFGSALFNSQQNPVIYKFHSAESGLIEIAWDTKKKEILWITREIEGQTFVALNEEQVSAARWPVLPKIPNSDHYSYWVSKSEVSPTIKIFDIKSDRAIAELTPEGCFKDLTSSTPDKTYNLIDLNTLPEWRSLTLFEDPKYILAKQSTDLNDPEALTIDFNRYLLPDKLQFTSRKERVDGKEVERLRWVQDPQWFISEEQKLNGLPAINCFLIVENGDGNRKIMLPKVLTRDAVKPPNVQAQIDFMTMDIDAEGRLLPKTTNEYLVAAYHSLNNKQYEQAMEFLTKADKMRRYSKDELKLLAWIFLSKAETNDGNPNALAIRLYASYLIKDNLFKHRRQKDQIFKTPILPEIYKKFSSQYADENQWMYFLLGKANWCDNESLDNSVDGRSFDSMIKDLYKDYLNVRKNVSAPLRVDASAEDTDTRFSLLSREDEISFMQRFDGNSLLNRRLNYLLTGVHDQIHIWHPDEELAEVDLSKSIISAHKDRNAFIKALKTKFEGTLDDARRKIDSLPTRMRNVNLDYPVLAYLALHGEPGDIEKVKDLLIDSGNAIGSRNYRDNDHPELKIIHLMLFSKENATKLNELIDNIQLPSASQRGRSFYGGSTSRQQSLTQEMIDFEAVYYELATQINEVRKAAYMAQKPSEQPVEKGLILPRISKLKPLDLTFTPPEGFRESILDRGERKLTFVKGVKPPQLEEIPLLDVQFPNPYAEKRYQDVKVDYTAAVNAANKQKNYHLRDPNEIGSIQFDLSEKIIANRAEALKHQIVQLASKLPPEGSLERIKADLALAGKKQTLPALADCLVAFAQKSSSNYLTLNPYLSQEDITELHHLIGSFLLEATNLKHYKQMLDSLDNPEELAKIAAIKRSYDPAKNPEMLVFEYMMGYILNPTQCKDIVDFITKDENGNYPNIFQQRMMGSGKTEVYGALIALLKADGEHLSIMVSPRTLFATNAQDIKERSGRLFGQKAKTITFSRLSSEFSVDYLQHIYNTLEQSIRNREFIIVPPEVLQSMENRYFEARKDLKKLDEEVKVLTEWEIGSEQYFKSFTEFKILEGTAALLEKSLKLIQEKGVITFDEVDAVLDIRKELNFPIGATESLNQNLTSMLKELYLIAAMDPEIRGLGLNLVDNKQHNLTKENVDEIIPVLSKKTCMKLFTDRIWKKRLGLDKLLKDVSDERLNVLLDKTDPPPIAQNAQEQQILEVYRFITDEKTDMPQFVKDYGYSSKPDEIEAAEAIMLLRQQFTGWLGLAWSKRGDEDYGLSKKNPDKDYAIPYVANNTPNERAEFADPWETANRTMQIYINKGASEKQVKVLYERLKEKAQAEWNKLGRPSDTMTVPTNKAFIELTGEPLLGSSIVPDFVALQEKINDKSNPKAMSMVLEIVVEQVLPKFKQYTAQVTHNAQNLSSLPETKDGYSGTIENFDLLPVETVQVKPDVGTKGKIVDVLFRKNNLVRVTQQETVGGILKETLYPGGVINPKAQMYQAIIDIGPKFTGISSHQVAKEIYEFYNTPENHPGGLLKDQIKGVIYWDDKTNLMMFIDKGSKDKPITLPNTDKETIARVTGLSNESIFYYYSHSKTTGAHAILPEDAIAIATVDAKTPLRNWLQGVMRMRQIWGNQHVETLIPKDVIPIIAQQLGKPELIEHPESITMQDIIAFCDNNESIRQQSDLLRGVVRKLQDHVRLYAKNKIYAAKETGVKNDLFEANEHLFIRKLTTSLFDKYSQKLTYKDKMIYLRRVVEDTVRGLDKEEQTAILNALFPPIAAPSSSVTETISGNPQLSNLVEKLGLVIDRAKPLLPNEIQVPPLSESWGQEVTNVQLQEQETEAAVETNQKQELNLELENELELTVLSENLGPTKVAKEEPWQFETIFNPGFPKISIGSEHHGDQPVVNRFTDILASSPTFHKYGALFPGNILVTKNYLATFENETNLFDFNQKNIHEVVAVYDPSQQGNPWKLMIVSLEEAAKFKELAKHQTDNPPHYMIVEPGLKIVRSGNFPATPEVMKSLQENLLPILFLTGDIKNIDSPLWRPLFKEWVTTLGSLKRNLLEINVLAKTDKGKTLYEGSKLQKYLHKELEDEEELDFIEALTAKILNKRIKNQDLLTMQKIILNAAPDDIDLFSRSLICLRSLFKTDREFDVKKRERWLATALRNERIRRDIPPPGEGVDSRTKLQKLRDKRSDVEEPQKRFISQLLVKVMEKVIPLIAEGNPKAIDLYLNHGSYLIEPNLMIKLHELMDTLLASRHYDIVAEMAKKQIIEPQTSISSSTLLILAMDTLQIISKLSLAGQKDLVEKLLEEIKKIDFKLPEPPSVASSSIEFDNSAILDPRLCYKHLSYLVAVNEILKIPEFGDNPALLSLKKHLDQFVAANHIDESYISIENWRN